MAELNLNQNDHIQIRDLVATSNKTRLNALLGCKSRKSRFEVASTCCKIAPSTPKACVLLSLLRSKMSKGIREDCEGADQICILTVEDILQALLMIYPSYITPWNALVEFSTTFPYFSGSILHILNCASSIEEFLLKTQFPFCGSSSQVSQSNVPRCIRDSMIQFSEKLSAQYGTRDTYFDKLVSELIQTTVTVCKSWCSDLFDNIVSTLYLRRPSPARMKIWLQLVKVSHPMLSMEQAEKIGRIMFDLFCDVSIKASLVRNIPSIVDIAVQMASPNREVNPDKKSPENLHKAWRKSLYFALYQILINHSEQCYIHTEKYLTTRMKKWTPESLKNWILEITDFYPSSTIPPNHQTIPSWFPCNILSLCTDILCAEDKSSRSQLVDMMIGNNVEGSKFSEYRLSEQEYQPILNCFFGNGGNSLPERQIDKMCYRIGGSFHAEEDDEMNIDSLSACASVVIQTLRLKNIIAGTSRESIKNNPPSASLLPRAMRLVNMADDIAQKCIDDRHSLRASVFAIIVRTVIYFEVPESRSTLELKIKQGISEPARLQNSYFSNLRLITTSAQKIDSNAEMLDKWRKIIDESIPFSHGTYMGCMFATFPLSQARILSRSKKSLAPLYSKWGSHTNTIRESKDFVAAKSQQQNIDGLRGLLELVRSDRWKSNEVQAWAILSDSFVEDLPPLPSEIRRWLLDSLVTSVTDGIFSAETLHHLLRAATTRISLFFVQDDATSNIEFKNSKKTDEIKKLHRLVTIILRALASMNEYNEGRHTLLAQGREAFLRYILSYKKGQTSQNQFHDGILEKLESMKSGHVDSFSVCYLLFLKVNFRLLHQSLKRRFEPNINEGCFAKEHASFLGFINGIKEIEERDLHLKVGNCQDPKTNFPCWINAGSKHKFRSETTDSVEQVKTSSFVPLLLDILIEFLFSVPLPTRESHDFNDPLSWKVISATGFLTNQESLSALSIETVKETAVPFLSISSLLIRKAFRLDCALSVLENLLVSTVSYCRVLHLTLEKAESLDCARLFGSLWNLYQAVASEKACVKIIHYLESHILDSDEVSIKRDDGVFSLSSIHSESDVDETVQQLRLSCLRPFLSCLSFMSDSEEGNSGISRGLVGGILGALATDMRAGLNGNSGGLPRELYITYCILIEECASLLFSQRQPSIDYSISLLFKEVASTLANILLTTPLRDAVLFRTTFILAAAVFPSMCRDLTRRSLCNPDSSAPIAADETLRIDSTIFDEVLNDCLGILNRWSALREPYLIPWLDIAGPDHSNVENDETWDDKSYPGNSSNAEIGRTGAIPRFVHVPSPPRNRHTSDHFPRKRHHRIRLQTKEVWSWALSCSLLGLEQKWLESERTIQTSEAVEGRDPCHASLADWKKFFGARRIDLQKSLVDMNRFFHTAPALAQRDHNGNRVLLDVVAMNLPSAPRSRFCCLIECVSRVLIHSIQHLCSTNWDASIVTRDLSAVESMCCVSAWLSLGEDPDDDFAVGLFKWLAIVSRKRPPGESAGSKNSDAAELHQRVSTVSEDVHRLVLALDKVPKTIRSLDNHSRSSEWMAFFFESEDASNEMVRLASRKLLSLKQVMPRDLYPTNSFPDFPSVETGVDSDPQGPGRRKRTRLETKTSKPKAKSKPKPKPKPKRLRRTNRNRVVDMFMDLDRGTNSPRRNSTRDAYADLEDFLVEG